METSTSLSKEARSAVAQNRNRLAFSQFFKTVALDVKEKDSDSVTTTFIRRTVSTCVEQTLMQTSMHVPESRRESRDPGSAKTYKDHPSSNPIPRSEHGVCLELRHTHLERDVPLLNQALTRGGPIYPSTLAVRAKHPPAAAPHAQQPEAPCETAAASTIAARSGTCTRTHARAQKSRALHAPN